MVTSAYSVKSVHDNAAQLQSRDTLHCFVFSEGEVEEGVTPLLHHKWKWSGAEGVNLLSSCVSTSAADKQSWRAVLIRIHGRWVCEVEEGGVKVEGVRVGQVEGRDEVEEGGARVGEIEEGGAKCGWVGGKGRGRKEY